MFQRVVEEHESRWRRTVFEFRIVIDDQLFKPRFDGCVISDVAVLTKRVIEIRVFFERRRARILICLVADRDGFHEIGEENRVHSDRRRVRRRV